MKKFILPYVAVAMSLLSQPAFSQTEDTTALLGLPGDNLDLYAVLTLFQKSKTIEEFESSLNDSKNKIKHFLVDNFGWKAENVLDLGGIESARTSEAYVPFWVTMMQSLGTPMFNVKVVK